MARQALRRAPPVPYVSTIRTARRTSRSVMSYPLLGFSTAVILPRRRGCRWPLAVFGMTPDNRRGGVDGAPAQVSSATPDDCARRTRHGGVSPGGPTQVRDLSALTITKVSVGPMDNNAYLQRCRKTGEQLLIDAANEASRLLELVGGAGLSTVVTTHQHHDHWQALAEDVAGTGARSVAHRLDAPELPVKSETIEDSARIPVGDCELEAIHLVGHTPGSIALLYQDPGGTPHLFTGDSLFPGGVGNTWGDAERFASLIDDVEHKLFDRLPVDTWFYPGHGDDSTLGAERPALPEWRARGW